MKRIYEFALASLMLLAGCAGSDLFASEPMGKQLERALEEIKKDCIARGAPPFGPGSSQYNDTSCLMFTLKPWEPGDTPESAFAHSIRLPPPHDKPKEVYKSGLSSEEYFNALCKEEAGEWVFRRVENVRQIRFERPFRKFPQGYQSIAYYSSEPSELAYQEPENYFVKPPLGKYSYLAHRLTSPDTQRNQPSRYRVVERVTPNGNQGLSAGSVSSQSFTFQSSETTEPKGDYGVVWRGVKRNAAFAEHAIEGHEVIVFDISSKQAFAIRRVFFQFFQESSGPRQDPRFAYARACPQKLPSLGAQAFVESVLIPTTFK